jgi:divalent metal cation (Fe/Co/Zn/Cd) transporter
VLAATFALDAYALNYALRPLRERALARHTSLAALLKQSTDPASTTVVLGGGCAVIGAVTAASGLITSQITGDATPDVVAGALIGLLLLVASVVLLHANRELLTGRGVAIPMLDQMRRLVAAQHGIIDVPDLFAVVVGPSSLIVIGDVTFADELDVPAVEETIMRSAAALRERWPSVHYVYLTPVPRFRLRRPDGEPTRSGRNTAPREADRS